MKRPQIDLTARVKTHLQSGEFRPTGFTLDDAELPRVSISFAFNYRTLMAGMEL